MKQFWWTTIPPKAFHRKYVAKTWLPVQILRLYKVVESQIYWQEELCGGFTTNSKIKTHTPPLSKSNVKNILD